MASEQTDKIKGRAKQAAGDLTDDDDLKAEGEVDEQSGKAKGAVDKLKERVDDTIDDVKDKLNR